MAAIPPSVAKLPLADLQKLTVEILKKLKASEPLPIAQLRTAVPRRRPW